ncbi:hypothetical protein [Hyphomicrobium sp. LHD-15]|uniref:hypothetical protein n=1 Tax=Hyphomicrobium sp. LHD-15 TaxID=3072142 RepID=UPI00280F3643|nr:hypothetical protein [Hyphomicrobium sp. LHD-15]MDQ8700751.1 hypothetical protein [Hyphomicrobium sp. LHD-15]
MFKSIIFALPLLVLGHGMANAGQTIDVAATMACVNDKWNETEPEKGHKLAEYAGRCVVIPNDSNAKNYVEDCAGNYEYMPDGSWKGAGTCSVDLKAGDTISLTWEEGSHLQDYKYEYTGGTGKYKGAKGGGTYKTNELTTTLYGGRKKGNLELP